MKVVILAGGLGTRLSEETKVIPKPMVEIGGRPIIWHIMMTYAQCGFTDFLICLGYRGDVVRRYFLDYHLHECDFTVNLATGDVEIVNCVAPNWKVTLVNTGDNTATGGRLQRCKIYLETSPFMLTYGDGVADIKIEELVKFHRSHGKLATMSTYHPLERFGLVRTDEYRRIVKMQEKGLSAEEINIGYFVLEPEVLNFLSDDETEPFELGALPRLVEKGELMSYKHNGFWQPMDILRDKFQLNELWDSGKADWKTW
ncbi:MAG: glucose-1-phosphate cytidylyltransferase [Planctomycetes bacterium]|nr:glucose-1-phosphate cytidylyltransferase [Planctomycetota bacterium]